MKTQIDELDAREAVFVESEFVPEVPSIERGLVLTPAEVPENEKQVSGRHVEAVQVTLALYPEVARFAQLMQQELEANAHKKHWSFCPTDYLQRRVHEEVGELERAIFLSKQKERGFVVVTAGLKSVAQEAVDVANMVMMLACNEGDLMGEAKSEATDE